MGARGPIPKARRLGHVAKGDRERATNVTRLESKPPPADRKWHPVARRLYASLAKSGQSEWYQASDWAVAWLLAESISRELSPQPVVAGGTVSMVSLPPKGSALAAWLKVMNGLLVTEGDRRRAALELRRPVVEQDGSAVDWIEDARRRLRGEPDQPPKDTT